jgi:hypothetical protein
MMSRVAVAAADSSDAGTGTVAPAAAEPEPSSPKPPEREVGEDDPYRHGRKFGLRAGLVAGYRMIFRYPKTPYCTKPDPTKAVDSQQKVCGFGAPLATEVALGFAPLDGLEPYVFGRFGFSGEARTNTQPLQMFGVGARLYTMSDSRFKFFVEPAVAITTEGGAGNATWTFDGQFKPSYEDDLVFHVGIGPQFDFARNVGAFLDAGLDVGVLRSINATLLANLGVQVRVP